MEKLILSLLSAAFGFFLSQFLNLLAYFRRPRFRVLNHQEGLLSAYTGDPPETPWEIELGFFLENHGKNPSRNTRIFVSDLSVWDEKKGEFSETTFSFSELSRPIDVLPAGECIRVLFAKISSESCYAQIPFEAERDEKENEYLSSDTRFAKKLRAKFFVSCDDPNSSKTFTLIFDPNVDSEWAAGFLEDYDSLEFRRAVVMPRGYESPLPER